MRLIKAGIVHDECPECEAGEIAHRPQDSMALFQYWHDTLEGIAEDYTFGDLVSLLRDVEDIERLSPLLGCDVPALLAEADRPRTVDDEEPIQHLQVRNVAVLTRYEEDPSHPDEPLQWLDDDEAAEQDRVDSGVAELTGESKVLKLVDATGDDPITGEPVLRRLRAPAHHGAWKPPHDVRREFEGWGKQSEPYDGYFRRHPEIDPECYEGPFALDFTPVSALLHLPLRFNPKLQFWSGPLPGDGEPLFETDVTIAFGEFLHTIFWELGFHGSPAERDAVLEGLRQRREAIDRMREQDNG